MCCLDGKPSLPGAGAALGNAVPGPHSALSWPREAFSFAPGHSWLLNGERDSHVWGS